MRLAVMQPYFFPYLGYWQLIHAVDTFVLLDEVQYIRHGWINRNRIGKVGGGWSYIGVPLERHAQKELVKNVLAHASMDWKSRILRQLACYRNRAPYFDTVRELVNVALHSTKARSIVEINRSVLVCFSGALGIKTRMLVSSECGFDYKEVKEAGDWALCIAKQLKADEYCNPIGGAKLFDPAVYKKNGVLLSFLHGTEVPYRQLGAFESSLSVIDALMFLGIDGCKERLTNYTRECVDNV